MCPTGCAERGSRSGRGFGKLARLGHLASAGSCEAVLDRARAARAALVEGIKRRSEGSAFGGLRRCFGRARTTRTCCARLSCGDVSAELADGLKRQAFLDPREERPLLEMNMALEKRAEVV
jgi:hypothetical protein